jgi:hypothetical protein
MFMYDTYTRSGCVMKRWKIFQHKFQVAAVSNTDPLLFRQLLSILRQTGSLLDKKE